MSARSSRRRILVFDVNETLLDIEVLHPFFARVFGDAGTMRQWFAELILYSEALSLSGRYVEFGTLSVAVLRMVAEIRKVTLMPADVEQFAATMRTLPPHRDVPEALNRLAAAGFRMVTLTNSTSHAGQAVLDSAGLTRYFERLFSVDEVKRFKPDREVYVHVANELAVRPEQLRLIAAHTWDTLGAMAAGYAAALVARPGNAPLPVGEQPDIVAPDLVTVADRIIATDIE
ncbi:haloacid dehalogenase type II [Burkholderia glumae]|uniref:(S)-2-haloacid dehalogenase n=1 Tax=Burkholderia glumae TaxID=337 RepID=A0AAQ0BUU4_BURGL|nr:haloacid dehalogenase type II [Burkholderia glumae]ACR32752.1 Haloacid dehalogenase, type II [Burkholderia glumae BGR1]AJY62388.1 haloacid dehalogenase, type II [Burkholderia glumae LMG 2196 = ATCC 33617]KHJ64939.1 haloacid dehalogenase [Burkholderia glumae]MCM2485753.1 haloacid dehalogenase type II [Burkholderia glumae]MCM2511591.1 haloacid dehalogenase type II [Burkholderia glumae]